MEGGLPEVEQMCNRAGLVFQRSNKENGLDLKIMGAGFQRSNRYAMTRAGFEEHDNAQMVGLGECANN